MNRKHNFKKSENIPVKLLKIAIIIILSYMAIRLGLAAGNVVYNLDSGIVKSIDVDTFKTTLKNSLPIIDTVYNSGNMSVSFSGEVKSLINVIFGFDLNKPLTILNAQSPVFYTYYNRSYMPFAAQRSIDNRRMTNEDSIEREQKEAGNISSESSITYEEDAEKKAVPDSDVVSNGKIAIQNETKLNINQSFIDELIKEPLKFKFDKKGPKILIYHTHTTEGYLDNLKNLNKKDVPASTSDPRYNVVRVGEELAQNLRRKYGIEVTHNGTIHDYDYNSSYIRSLNTASAILKSYPSIKVTFDIHRDAMGDNQPKLRAVSNINGKNTAKVMFVVGTDQIGLSHPNWKENFKLALKLQEKLNEISPDLTKPIYISKNRYNQHLTSGSLIIEIGGDGNTLEEALESTKYLSEAINAVANSK